MTEQLYTTDYGNFYIRKTRFLWESVSEDGTPLLTGPSPESLWIMTPSHLESHALGLKEERSYSGTVGGKL